MIHCSVFKLTEYGMYSNATDDETIKIEFNVLVPSSYKFHRSLKCCSRVPHTYEKLTEVEMPHNHLAPMACKHFPIFSSLYHHLQRLVLCSQ